MRIALGADHAGFELKRDLAATIAQQGHEILDVGPFTAAAVDYPDIAEAVAIALRDGKVDRGVIVCGSGAGVSVAANKFPGIRAAVWAVAAVTAGSGVLVAVRMYETHLRAAVRTAGSETSHG